MSDDIPTKEDFIRNSIDLDRSKGWELISASTIMKNEFKYSGAKFEIVQSYLHAIDILSNPSYNGSYNQNFKIVSLFIARKPVEFVNEYDIEIVFFAIFYHLTEVGTIVVSTRHSAVYISS